MIYSIERALRRQWELGRQPIDGWLYVNEATRRKYFDRYHRDAMYDSETETMQGPSLTELPLRFGTLCVRTDDELGDEAVVVVLTAGGAWAAPVRAEHV